MQRNYLIIDGNSIGHQANSLKPLTMGTMQVQAIFGFFRIIRAYTSKYSFATPIVLWDGMSWRNTIYPEYKDNRSAEVTKHDLERKEARRHYNLQRPYIEKALSMLGVTQIKAHNMEADDLAAILTKHYRSQGHKITLLTEDRDWLQLIQDGVAVELPKAANKVRVTMANFEEITGCKTTANFVEMKALMGDDGDHIKGVGGIAKKRALEFLETYGSFNTFLNMVTLEKSVDLNKLPKWQRDLVTDETKALAFDFNIKLVDLNTSARPAPKDMNVFHGEPSVENFRKFCDLLLFKSFTDKFDDWISAFPVAHQKS